MIELTALLAFLASYIHVIGWGALMAAAWKLSRLFTRAEMRVLKSEAAIEKMSTNCFPTMQKSLQNQDVLLHTMNESLKIIAANTTKKSKK
jgi:hypothetical protein